MNEELSSLFGKSEYVKENKENKMLKAAADLLRSEEGVKEIYMPKLNAGRNLNIDEFFKKGYIQRIWEIS